MRGKQLMKMLKALELLSKPNGSSIQNMADVLNVDVRSVYRLLDSMQDMGFPIWDEKNSLGKKKQWKIEESFLLKLPNIKIPNFNLTYIEIIFLYMLKNESFFFQDTKIEKYIKSAFFKINQFIPSATKKLLDKINGLFITKSFPSKSYQGKEDIIQELIEFMIKSESCLLKYHSFYDDKLKAMGIDPLHFFYNKGGLYIIVRKTGLNDIRILAVERIIDIEGINRSFEYPTNIDPKKFLDSSFDLITGEQFNVQIWFSKNIARYIKERSWSCTQEINNNEDGSIILSMHTSGWVDIKSWILSYGSDARVLKPQKMINEIITETKKILNSYKEQ